MTGQTVSHYRVLEKLGQGGMGEVYLAEDSKLKRQVALKFLPRQMTADPETKERFEREAQAAAAFNHPNIVTIHEIGEHEGQVFIAMEYVEGRTLKELISGSVGANNYSPLPITHHPLPITQVIDIAAQIASGLAAAHAKGIVHRDVKPQNILVDQNHHVKILDFGLAKLKGVSSLTKESSTLGTVHYMSPEQTMGKEVDQRSDIWSLGVVLYEILTGRLPFKGDYEQAVIYSILNEDPGSVISIRKDISPEFDRILEKALAKEPEDRYQHVDDLLVDLKYLRRDSRPDHQPSPSAPRRKTGSWLKWAIPATILSGAFAMALFFITRDKPKPDVPSDTTASPPVKAARTHSIAVLPFKNLSDSKEDEYFSDGITEDIITQLAKIGDLKVISRTSIMQYKNLAKNIREIGRELDVATVLEGSVRRSGDRIRITSQLIDAETDQHLWAETYDREIQDVFAIQSDVAKQIAAALEANISPEVKTRIAKTQTENTEAYQLLLKGRFFWNKRTAADLKKAIAYFSQAIEKDPGYAQAYAGLANSYAIMPLFEFARRDYKRKSQQAAAKALELDATLGEAYCVLGSIHQSDFDWKNAEMNFRRAIELDPNYPTARQWYSQLLSDLGRFSEALPEAKRALALDPLSLPIRFGVGLIYYQMRQYDKAVDLSRKGIELDPSFPWSYYIRGLVAEARGELDKAIRDYHESRQLAYDDPTLLGEIGRVYARMGRKDDALKALGELREYHENGFLVSVAIANVYHGLGDKERTFEWLERSLADHEIMITDIITYPLWDDLRSEPRFITLLKKMGLPR